MNAQEYYNSAERRHKDLCKRLERIAIALESILERENTVQNLKAIAEPVKALKCVHRNKLDGRCDKDSNPNSLLCEEHKLRSQTIKWAKFIFGW
jgi:hypothetical protein